ncbi:natterin-3-like [Polypterus senegalus]|uniref:natterin-3-like n=1 Tax=Polypterus senegalus TaxID=55291 RepID=UPI0019640D47|nr:natterin-3-like [Polypterus senegalus]
MSSQLRSLDSPSVVGNTVSLQWVHFNGSVPSGTVSILNDYASRTDFVCKAHCEPGFYNSSIKSCEDYNAVVGKNSYGLGMVVPKHSAFFLPWEGKEYYYKYYDVLSINTGSYSQKISNDIYDTNQANLLEQPPEVLNMSSLDNYECQSIKRTVTLKATTMSERCCNIQHSALSEVFINVTAGIPVETLVLKEQTTVVGKYQGEEISEVKVVVELCEQIPNAQPCPSA